MYITEELHLHCALAFSFSGYSGHCGIIILLLVHTQHSLCIYTYITRTTFGFLVFGDEFLDCECQV